MARTMTAEDYLIDAPEEPAVSRAIQRRAQTASGNARQAAGMAPYPLYGIGQTPPPPETTPFYRANWFWFANGTIAVGALWAYFGWWRPRHHKAKKKSEKNRHRFKAARNQSAE